MPFSNKLLLLASLLFTAQAAFAASAAVQSSAAEVPVAAAAHSPIPAAAEVFQRLARLQGTWKGRLADGREHQVNYRLSAGDTVLVETWALAPGRESMTLYYVDDGELLATHYCPQGNQPRLRWVPEKSTGRLAFELKDGGNLQVPGGWHQQRMWLRLGAAAGNTFVRSETYIENGSSAAEIATTDDGAAVVYSRVASP